MASGLHNACGSTAANVTARHSRRNGSQGSSFLLCLFNLIWGVFDCCGGFVLLAWICLFRVFVVSVWFYLFSRFFIVVVDLHAPLVGFSIFFVSHRVLIFRFLRWTFRFFAFSVVFDLDVPSMNLDFCYFEVVCWSWCSFNELSSFCYFSRTVTVVWSVCRVEVVSSSAASQSVTFHHIASYCVTLR